MKALAELLPRQGGPAAQKQLKELHATLMAIMSSLRAANARAALPGGRERAKQLPPTRCRAIAVEERPKSHARCDPKHAAFDFDP